MLHAIGLFFLLLPWMLLGLAAIEGLIEDMDKRKQKRREKRERPAREAAARKWKEEERQREIARTIETVQAGKWPHTTVNVEGWSEEQQARLAKAIDICVKRAKWRAERDARREREADERREEWLAEYAKTNGGIK